MLTEKEILIDLENTLENYKKTLKGNNYYETLSTLLNFSDGYLSNESFSNTVNKIMAIARKWHKEN